MKDALTIKYWFGKSGAHVFSSILNQKWFIPAVISAFVLLIIGNVSAQAANWVAIGLFLLGVPHGAVERTPEAPRFIMPTLSYTALYIVFGIVVFSSWLISPLGTFIIFLLMSAWHFGQSEPSLKLIGAWAVIGSCLIYPAQTLGIFALLIDSEVPDLRAIQAAQIIAIGCLFALLIEYLWRVKAGEKPSLLRLGFMIVLLIVLPPIPAVAVYFFALHGLGEFMRTIASVSRANSNIKALDILKLYGPATFPAMIGAGVIIVLTYQGHIPIWIASGLGVAFIIPHMLPVEDLLQVDREAARRNHKDS